MSTLKEIARLYAAELRSGVAWVAVWKTGRDWNARTFWLDCGTQQFEQDDIPEVLSILEADHAAVLLNGYYNAHFAQQTVADIAYGIRWHYVNDQYRMRDCVAPKTLDQCGPKLNRARVDDEPEI